ncbi:MAG: hypothetical protein AMJ42_04305 [Deltaproteobacteria bacterium DG_8]|nr:MAG: hypothetical protein AMJ42_04305 [Deltaproteobacteria bacterium DG_8]
MPKFLNGFISDFLTDDLPILSIDFIKEVTDSVLNIFRGVKEIFEKADLEWIITDSSCIPLYESTRFKEVNFPTSP